jgi:hypothetical protein
MATGCGSLSPPKLPHYGGGYSNEFIALFDTVPSVRASSLSISSTILGTVVLRTCSKIGRKAT